MTPDPLISSDFVIQLHVALAAWALVTGPISLYGRKNKLHKVMGYAWVTSMTGVAISSFFIDSFAVIGPFSPIHLLSLFTLWSLFEAMRQILAGNVALHRRIMRNLYWYGLIIAGAFNFLPGRTTSEVFFSATPNIGYVVISLVGVGVLVHLMLDRKASRLQQSQSIRA